MIRRHTHALRLSVALLAASFVLLTFSVPVKARTTSGSISGTIVDPQSGSIANAAVKATNTATQAGATVPQFVIQYASVNLSRTAGNKSTRTWGTCAFEQWSSNAT
jgi:hypothetical protein